MYIHCDFIINVCTLCVIQIKYKRLIKMYYVSVIGVNGIGRSGNWQHPAGQQLGYSSARVRLYCQAKWNILALTGKMKNISYTIFYYWPITKLFESLVIKLSPLVCSSRNFAYFTSRFCVTIIKRSVPLYNQRHDIMPNYCQFKKFVVNFFIGSIENFWLRINIVFWCWQHPSGENT